MPVYSMRIDFSQTKHVQVIVQAEHALFITWDISYNNYV